MKFTSALVLAAVASTSAFTVQPPAAAKTALAAGPNSRVDSSIDYDSTKPFSGVSPGARGNTGFSSSVGSIRETKAIFDEIDQITVQGGSLKTCSFNEGVDRVSVFMKTEGRPLTANVDLWQGPDNTPQKMAVYLEDGNKRPFRAIVETPGASNAVSIRNTAQLEYPWSAGLELDYSGEAPIIFDRSDFRIVQGGAVYTTPFAPAVQSVRLCLMTDGRPLNARVELLQGPNNDKQVMEVYTEDGMERPFNIIIDTPGVGNVVRIVNTATVEFPLTAALEPYLIDENAKYEQEGSGMVWR